MKNHIMVQGKFLQMNKTYKQLKERQKIKINEWLYKAYVNQQDGKMNEIALLEKVFAKISEADIWLPEDELISYYQSHKNKFEKRYQKCKGIMNP